MAIQVQEFAERVLFGTTIEAKLSFPREAIIDTRPGDAIVTPRRLTRPKHLMLRDDGVRAKPPSQAKLLDEKERGKLLHFFGNHELLATELMALALLKFPYAPASFRRGLLETLKDEQMHTRLYMHRMEQCGVEFGELPLNEYFWKSVSSMEDPLDYVTRLSLTFEQANLDYSREYGKIFDSVGDTATAKILTKIYHDEIDHVGFGLKWFRKWKASGKTDWEAYRERLVFPLSPARAKGNDFNTEGRREVGLDPNFINDLEIFQQSRGRTPNVLWFNPNAEQCAAANRDGDDLCSKATTQLQHDLAFLPAYLSRQDDVLILSQAPSPEFLSKIQSYGFPLPEIHGAEPAASGIGLRAPDLNRKIGDLRPWAWSPDSHAFFERNLHRVTRPRPPDALWNEELRELYSKTWSAQWGQALAAENQQAEWIAPDLVYGRTVHNLDELQQARRHFADLGYPDIACKAPFGTAAHGNRCLLADEALSPALLQWLELIRAQQGSLVVEPWLDRVFDFSIQYEMNADGLKQVGTTRMVNNLRGQFQGIITNAFCKGLDPVLVRFIMDRSNGRPRLFHHYETIVAPRLETALKAAMFHGPIGIDALICRDRNGQLQLKTVVEINPRFTMGRVAHELGRHIAPHAVGLFQIITNAQVRKTSTPNFTDWASQIEHAHPVELTKHPKPLIRSGSFALNDPKTAKQFLAVYHVRESIHALPLD